jgi:hypothetical protein
MAHGGGSEGFSHRRHALSTLGRVPRGNDVGPFHHQDDRALRRSRPVQDAFRHDEALARCELDNAVLQVDQKATLDNVEEIECSTNRDLWLP